VHSAHAAIKRDVAAAGVVQWELGVGVGFGEAAVVMWWWCMMACMSRHGTVTWTLMA
jgi:hypothetical protein